MRRAQSVRHHARPSSLALGTDDLGVLKEGDESNEDVLRRQLLDKDRENDKVKTPSLLCLGFYQLKPLSSELPPPPVAYPNPTTPTATLRTSPGRESSGARERVQEFGLDPSRDTARE